MSPRRRTWEPQHTELSASPVRSLPGPRPGVIPQGEGAGRETGRLARRPPRLPSPAATCWNTRAQCLREGKLGAAPPLALVSIKDKQTGRRRIGQPAPWRRHRARAPYQGRPSGRGRGALPAH